MSDGESDDDNSDDDVDWEPDPGENKRYKNEISFFFE